MEVKQLVDGTADAAYAVDAAGQIVAWNPGAETLFGTPASLALGTACSEIVNGADECGQVCSADCTVLQSARAGHPLHNFDLLVRTPQGPRWCNVSVLIAANGGPTPFTVHIVRLIDTRKKLELLLRDFVVTQTNLPANEVSQIMKANRTPATDSGLSTREIDVLKRMASGSNSEQIAKECNISRTTVNNHIQHIIRKLDAHSRLEAIRKAEHAGLI